MFTYISPVVLIAQETEEHIFEMPVLGDIFVIISLRIISKS